METLTVNGASWRAVRLLGKGKGGYSWLAERDGREVVVKQIHHEPCDYYRFGDKLAAERNDYRRLREAGIRVPEMLDVDVAGERIVKEYVGGETIAELLDRGRDVGAFLPQVREMAARARATGLNIDYYPTPVNPVTVVGELAPAAGSTAVVGGQVEDMLSETGAVPHDLSTLSFIQQHKTGDLIRAATRMGALAANASDATLAALTAYADAIGEAFQVADDILDATSTAEIMGKSTQSDAARGKLTAVTLHGLSSARARLDALTAAALDALAPLDSPAAARLAALARWLHERTN